jgi:hypothetical protein
MKKNLNNMDRVVRLILSAILAFLYFSNVMSGTMGLILISLAGILVLTTFTGFCPIYALLGWSSCPVKKRRAYHHTLKSRA